MLLRRPQRSSTTSVSVGWRCPLLDLYFVGTSSSNGFVQQATRPPRPPRPTSRPTTRPVTRPPRPSTRPPRPPPTPLNNRPSTGSNDDSGQSANLMNSNNNGRMLPLENRGRVLQKRAPAEATSLQSLLSHHKIDTNVLKTRAQIAQPQPRPISNQILTPSGNNFRHRRPLQTPSGIRTENQRPLPDNFYTNSDIFPQFSVKNREQVEPKQVIEKQDLGEARPKTSFRETAIIALKLSQSILNLYKTVSPYFS